MQPFETMVAEHAVVLRVCCGLRGPVDADDAWSETFLAALRAYPTLPPGSNVRRWLVTIAHRKAIDQIRAWDRRPEPSGDLPDTPSADPGPAPGDGELHGALRGVAVQAGRSGCVPYLADLSYSEVAALLECSEAAARRSAADGIASLRRHYRKDNA